MTLIASMYSVCLALSGSKAMTQGKVKSISSDAESTNTFESAYNRTMHTCKLAGNRRMLSVGGIDPSKANPQSLNNSDPWPQGLGIFDMVELQWTGSYDATALPYTPADAVKEWYSQP